jgi:molecular chaperone IbpA
MTRIDTINLPHFHKATIGFDRLFNELNRGFENSPNGNEYMISVAVAGFGMDNLDVTTEGNQLKIEGTAPKGDEDVNYLHKGIGGRNFRREFTLADHVEVDSAGLELGMLNVHLVRNIPDALKPKKIDINLVGE